MNKSFALLSLAALAAGCSYHARGPEDYAKVTQEVLETRAESIKACYDEALKSSPTIAGRVTVRFTVQAETGDLTGFAVDPENTNAPEALSTCVINSLQGLKLAPPDERNGLATFSWDFQVGGPAPVAEPAPAPAT